MAKLFARLRASRLGGADPPAYALPAAGGLADEHTNGRTNVPKLSHVDLTRRENQIMEILYRRRRATVEEIRDELPDAPSPSSVRKLLDIMIGRGLLAREYDGPRFVYFPAVKPEEASRSALKQLVRTFFNNSPGSAMAALLDLSSTELTQTEYRRLSSLLKRAREQGGER